MIKSHALSGQGNVMSFRFGSSSADEGVVDQGGQSGPVAEAERKANSRQTTEQENRLLLGKRKGEWSSLVCALNNRILLQIWYKRLWNILSKIPLHAF